MQSIPSRNQEAHTLNVKCDEGAWSRCRRGGLMGRGRGECQTLTATLFFKQKKVYRRETVDVNT